MQCYEENLYNCMKQIYATDDSLTYENLCDNRNTTAENPVELLQLSFVFKD